MVPNGKEAVALCGQKYIQGGWNDLDVKWTTTSHCYSCLATYAGRQNESGRS